MMLAPGTATLVAESLTAPRTVPACCARSGVAPMTDARSANAALLRARERYARKDIPASAMGGTANDLVSRGNLRGKFRGTLAKIRVVQARARAPKIWY